MFRFWIRLFTGFVTPLILGSLAVAFSGIFGPAIDGFKNFIFILIVATVFMGIQSIVYSLLMEWLAAFLRKRRADMGFLVIVSTILGGLAGSTLIFLTPGFVYTGLAVGVVCGLILYGLHQFSYRSARHSTAAACQSAGSPAST